jgi:hypothetical protein
MQLEEAEKICQTQVDYVAEQIHKSLKDSKLLPQSNPSGQSKFFVRHVELDSQYIRVQVSCRQKKWHDNPRITLQIQIGYNDVKSYPIKQDNTFSLDKVLEYTHNTLKEQEAKRIAHKELNDKVQVAREEVDKINKDYGFSPYGTCPSLSVNEYGQIDFAFHDLTPQKIRLMIICLKKGGLLKNLSEN